MIRVAVVGATGYTGGELLRILLGHPEARIVHVTSESRPGRKNRGHASLPPTPVALDLGKVPRRTIGRNMDPAFFALPHGVGSKTIADFVAQGKRAIDLSADFRLKNVKTYEAWYKSNTRRQGF